MNKAVTYSAGPPLLCSMPLRRRTSKSPVSQVSGGLPRSSSCSSHHGNAPEQGFMNVSGRTYRRQGRDRGQGASLNSLYPLTIKAAVENHNR